MIAAIDIGGTNTKIAPVTRDGIVASRLQQFATPSHGRPEDLLSAIATRVESLADVAGAGICTPGLFSDDREVVVFNPNTPVLENYPLRRELEARLRIPVTLEVDAVAAALGEYRFGAGSASRRLLVISLGTGVGASMLVDGRPLRFTGNGIGDVGHVYVGGGRRCTSGCLGCLEAMVSIDALMAAAPGSPTVAALIASALAGDVGCREVLQQAGRFIGIGITALASCFEPDLVLLAGGIAEAGDLLTAAAQSAIAEFASPHFAVPVRKASLGGRAALAGAAVALLFKE
ncbi:MAG: ROK family protein [Acidobacteria bacterium]|nr:ROK family protein [Acidobacteriota bacterium]